MYRWEGAVHEDDERLLFVKTTDDAVDALCDRIRALHPYDAPCIERFDADNVLDAYADWMTSVVATGSD